MSSVSRAERSDIAPTRASTWAGRLGVPARANTKRSGCPGFHVKTRSILRPSVPGSATKSGAYRFEQPERRDRGLLAQDDLGAGSA